MAFCADGDTAVSPVIKYTLLLGAMFHWILAAGLIAIGAWAFEERNKFFYAPIEDVNDILFNVSIMMMICGGIMFVINTCGVIGALRENVICLKIFWITLLVIFLAEVALGVVAIVFKDKVVDVFTDALKEVYVEEYHRDVEGFMNYFQETYKCCGVRSYTDWNINDLYNCSDSNPSQLKCEVPYTCCKNQFQFTPGLVNLGCGGGALDNTTGNTENIYTEGCLDTLVNLMETNLPLVGAICIAIAIPQLVGIFLGRKLAQQIRQQWRIYRKGQYEGRRWYPYAERSFLDRGKRQRSRSRSEEMPRSDRSILDRLMLGTWRPHRRRSGGYTSDGGRSGGNRPRGSKSSGYGSDGYRSRY